MPDQQISSNGARARLFSKTPVKERILKLAGISTAVVEAGEGPPIVLLHGPAGHAAHFMRVIPLLAQTHRIIAPDLPAHGASEAFDGALDVARVSNWLGELLQRTCSSTPALVGHLLGGSIAARFASDNSAQLSRLVLIDTFGLTPLAPAPKFGAAISEFLAAPSRASHRTLWQYCAHDFERVARDMGSAWGDFEAYNIERAQTPAFQAASPVLMQLFGAPLSPARLESISVPTTLVWGRHDLATPLAIAQAASKRHGWPLHVIENANDDPPFEQPEALVAVLRVVLTSER